jgi:hypothetical protein
LSAIVRNPAVAAACPPSLLYRLSKQCNLFGCVTNYN